MLLSKLLNCEEREEIEEEGREFGNPYWELGFEVEGDEEDDGAGWACEGKMDMKKRERGGGAVCFGEGS